MSSGKKEFYSKAQEALESKGYDYYDGDRDVHGKGRQHANKPDYIAVHGSKVFIGEIKSPAEGPKSGSWRQIQHSDTEQFAAVRNDVVKREKAGAILPEIGGHEIIICGQIADYVRKIGINFDLPASVPDDAEIMMAYTAPEAEGRNIEEALSNCGKKVHEKIDIGNGSITYLFS